MKAIPKEDVAIEVDTVQVDRHESVNIHCFEESLDSGSFPGLVVRWNGSAWVVHSAYCEVISLKEEHERQA